MLGMLILHLHHFEFFADCPLKHSFLAVPKLCFLVRSSFFDLILGSSVPQIVERGIKVTYVNACFIDTKISVNGASFSNWSLRFLSLTTQFIPDRSLFIYQL